MTQDVPPRLLLRGEAADAEGPAGVRGVYSGEPPPPDALAELTDNERLFASARQAGRQGKSRPGEGRDCDTAGFEPPDAPEITGE
ncbi:hypothetical protein GCM10020367_54030 [Streptomyces sannanensis]|uniref:DUF397 domain-containing protein n=1 Tax=Streptomyces sannanensis TaxID=285536 RepID=A0ABP6SJ13_9ACTN